ncbi:hypothetical protein FisN_1Hh318 [Fistulifera solaris]|jgi:hypothetical protein|uniref:Uncharacterized protein n=1 Tax=Fistulifera solaris TaxID=1519565 RepID=A0A1Z5JEF6_FISSO|nr:hypothetical protein FisN_1Hh318 [Fistulifera solaris]|eukprot:GAX12384.1 hypothetical protein FisN_1Hh318 [Fistulifera solaris]
MHFIDIPTGRRSSGTKSGKPILKRSSISTTTTEESELTELSKNTSDYDGFIEKVTKEVASELVKSYKNDDGSSCAGSNKSVDSHLDIQQIAESLVNNHRRCDMSESSSRCSGGSSTKASEAVFHPDFWCAELLDLEDEGSVLGALSTHSKDSAITISAMGDDDIDDDISVVSDITSYFPEPGAERTQKTQPPKVQEESKVEETKVEKDAGVMLGFTVQFSTITVREYPIMMGDNPAVSDGPPLTIDWEYNELPYLDVEAFETVRRSRRTGKSLVLSRKRRENILRNVGYQDVQIVAGIRHVKKLQSLRMQTVANLGSEKVEEAIQNVGRRMKGMLNFGSRRKQPPT